MYTAISAAWKAGFSSLHKADAQSVAEEIISIGESATPEQIVDKARDQSTELHKCFEWDDTTAAEKYRLQQARQIVCHLVIRETIAENKPPIRFFFKPDSDSGYQPTRTIVRNQDSYQNLLASAMRDLDALRRKYHSLCELDRVFEEIDQLIQGKAG